MKTTEKPKRAGKLLDAPLAVASDGTLLVNVAHLDGMPDPVAAVQRLVDDGHQVFVGVAVPAPLRRELLRDIDGAAADVVGRLGPRLRRQRAR